MQTRYLHGDGADQILARESAGGVVAWYVTDHLDSVRDLVDDSGVVLDHRAYDAFGNITAETNPAAGDRYGYTGREFDAVTGLQYNRGRFYDAATGTWTTQDPKGFDAGQSNLYVYAGNASANNVDPSGLDFVRVEGDRVIYVIEGQDDRSTLRRAWDGMVGNVPNFNQEVVIGHIGSAGLYAGPNSPFTGSVILSDEFGGLEVPYSELQAAARASNLSGTSGTGRTAAIKGLADKVDAGLFHSELPTQDFIVGTVDSVGQSALDLKNGFEGPRYRKNEAGQLVEVPPPTFAEYRELVTGDLVSNKQGPAYHHGQIAGEALNTANDLRQLQRASLGGSPSSRSAPATPITRGYGSSPRISTPNSIYEQYDANNNLVRRNWYDQNGNRFNHTDFQQKEKHMVEENGVRYNLAKHPHEHELRTFTNPDGTTYVKWKVRILDSNGNPLTGWLDD